MSIHVDPITHKKLLLVKQLYQHAVIQSESQKSYVGRIMSLIGFDLAVETILKVVVVTLEPAKTPADSFQSLIQQADNALTNSRLQPILDRPNIQHIHSLRNDAQHKAKYPNETDLSDCRTYTRDFLRKIIFVVWGVSFETMRLTDLIQNSQVKQLLVDAETALDSGDYLEAEKKAEAGLNNALGLVEGGMLGVVPYKVNAFMVSDGENVAPDSDTFRIFRIMRDVLLRSALGLNTPEYIKYRQLLRTYRGKITNLFSLDLKEKPPLSAKDAEFVVTFATNAVLQIESLVGNLESASWLRGDVY